MPYSPRRGIRTCPEQEVLHFATLLVFQSVTGVLPLLPRPAMPSPATAGSPKGEYEEDWPGLLLNAIRGEASSEAEQALTNLRRDIQVMYRFVVCIYSNWWCMRRDRYSVASGCRSFLCSAQFVRDGRRSLFKQVSSILQLTFMCCVWTRGGD